MVFKINKGYTPASLPGLLAYHHDKLAKGLAEKDYLFATTSMENPKTIEKEFVNHMRTHNPKVYKNYFVQITTNFNSADQIDNRTKREVIDNYLTQMGYTNMPMVAYRHFDKDHDHWHIITTASDFDGNRIDIRNDHHQSNLISRNIEKSYGLKVLNSVSEHQSQDEKKLNQNKYRIYRACSKLHTDQKLWNTLKKHHNSLTLLCLNPLKKIGSDQRPLTNDAIRRTYLQIGSEQEYQIALKAVEQHGLLKDSSMERIKKRALAIKKNAHSLNEFIRKFNSKEEGFYARNVQANGEIQYGCDGYYINKPGILGQEFKRSELLRYFDAKSKGIDVVNPARANPFTFDQRKKYIKSSVQKASAQSSTWADFETILKEKFKIYLIETERGNGSNTLTFWHDETQIKSSAIGLSYSKLQTKIETNNKVKIQLLNFKDEVAKDILEVQIMRPDYMVSSALKLLKSTPNLRHQIIKNHKDYQHSEMEIRRVLNHAEKDTEFVAILERNDSTMKVIPALKIWDQYGLLRLKKTQLKKPEPNLDEHVENSIIKTLAIATTYDELKSNLKENFQISINHHQDVVKSISFVHQNNIVPLKSTAALTEYRLGKILSHNSKTNVGMRPSAKKFSRAFNQLLSIMERDAFLAEIQRSQNQEGRLGYNRYL